MNEYTAKVGRDRLPEVVLGGANKPGEILPNQEIADRVHCAGNWV